MFVASVEACDTLSTDASMTYAYYHKVVKGKSPKNAPTYIEEERDVTLEMRGSRNQRIIDLSKKN